MTVIHGDCLGLMSAMDADSVDSIVTDPPYGLSFMGKEWDHGVPGEPFWREALRVAKPGSRLLAFGGTRTYHRLAVAIEDAGWEIEDCISWLYGSGFPKHKSKLKPAWEPVIVARKPAKYATPLRIDDCRIAGVVTTNPAIRRTSGYGGGLQQGATGTPLFTTSGRWPANVCLDEEAAAALDAMSGERKSGGGTYVRDPARSKTFRHVNEFETTSYGDTGGASRFFYCAKASRREREAGLDGMASDRDPAKSVSHTSTTMRCEGCGRGHKTAHRGPCLRCGGVCIPAPSLLAPTANSHPTVKPLALMRWLCRLVTPPGGIVLDPFMGSGTTGCAAALEGFRFLGCEREAEYVAIAERRIAHWAATVEPVLELAG